MTTKMRHCRAGRFASGLAAALALAAAANAQSVLVDFGSNTSWRGVSVVNPDEKGHYWNSLQPGLYYMDVLDMANVATTIDLGFSTPVGTDSYNGPAGPTSDPPTPEELAATDVDLAALGDLGVVNAVFDYAAGDNGPCRFEIQGLDPVKRYTLTIFGSHKFNSDPTTIYTVYSDNTYTTAVGSASLDVHVPGFPWQHNMDTVATIANLAPQTSNILYVEFVGNAGGNGYLNAFKLEGISTACPNPGCDDGGIDADFDGNCDVVLTDLAILLANFGTPGGMTNGTGDTDGDSDVDLTDLAQLLARFGTDCN